MPASVVQVDYELLENIARAFDAQANTLAQQTRTIQQTADDLVPRGWEGQGSAAFEREMQREVLPRLKRAIDALLEARQTTYVVIDIFREAEAEAGQLFRGQKAEVSPGSVPLTDGGIYDANGNPNVGNPDVIFINGILTDETSFKKGLKAVDDKFDGNVVGVFNNTQGAAEDIRQAFDDRYEATYGIRPLGTSNAAVDELVKQIKNDPDGKVKLVAHSQGGAITAAALQRLYREDPHFAQKYQIDVTTFGSFGTAFPPGPQYHHYVMKGDLVPMAANLIGSGTAQDVANLVGTRAALSGNLGVGLTAAGVGLALPPDRPADYARYINNLHMIDDGTGTYGDDHNFAEKGGYLDNLDRFRADERGNQGLFGRASENLEISRSWSNPLHWGDVAGDWAKNALQGKL